MIDEIDLPIIVDAGIGRPSQACEAMEMGAAAIMANTAIATAGDIPAMAEAFKQAIEDYSDKAEHYQADVCRVPQSVNLTFTEGAFVFLVPAALFLAPSALAAGEFAGFITDFVFYAVFSAIISTSLAKIMFASSGIMLAQTALGRIGKVMAAPALKISAHPQTPHGNKVEF